MNKSVFVQIKILSRLERRESIYFITYRYYRPSLLVSHHYQCLRNLHKDHGQSTKLVHSRWRRWYPWTLAGAGVSVLAVFQWRRLNKARDYPPESVVKEFEITCYRSLPLRLWSRVWGWLCSRQIPKPMRSWVLSMFCSVYGVDLKEVNGDFEDYSSIQNFFTRALKKGSRPIDPDDCIVSPADGRVLTSGRIHSCHVEQVKGVVYNLQTFLGEPTWKSSESSQASGDHPSAKSLNKIIKPGKMTDENDNEIVKSKTDADKYVIPEVFWGGVDVVRYLFKAQEELHDNVLEKWDEYKSQLLMNPKNVLYQVVVYLAPADYHRFHSPVEWKVNFRRHFQGELMSVNPLIAGWVPGLYSLNERVAYVGQWKHGFFSMTMVGATGVGSVVVYEDKDLTTNKFSLLDNFKHIDAVMDLSWKKGEEVGEFRFGSTIVLVFEAPKDYQFNLCREQKVRVGQPLSACLI